MLFDVIKAILLGIVEGLTEFLPVSSTGHLLLVDHFFGPEPGKQAFWDSFNVLIQFGAILALLSIYFGRLWRLAIGFFTDPASRRFVLGAAGGIRYERPFTSSTYRALPVAGRPDVWVEVRVPAGQETGRWDPPRTFSAIYAALNSIKPTRIRSSVSGRPQLAGKNRGKSRANIINTDTNGTLYRTTRALAFD